MDDREKRKNVLAGWLMQGVALAWGIAMILMFYLRN
jgi:hypothetical protein